jgi:hypothetical protein
LNLSGDLAVVDQQDTLAVAITPWVVPVVWRLVCAPSRNGFQATPGFIRNKPYRPIHSVTSRSPSWPVQKMAPPCTTYIKSSLPSAGSNDGGSHVNKSAEYRHVSPIVIRRARDRQPHRPRPRSGRNNDHTSYQHYPPLVRIQICPFRPTLTGMSPLTVTPSCVP